MIYKLSWLTWIVGSILIALSWTGTVSPRTGWIGFGVAMFGTVMSFFQPRHRCATPAARQGASVVVDDLAKLADLRDRGAISEEEFARQKKAILDRTQPK